LKDKLTIGGSKEPSRSKFNMKERKELLKHYGNGLSYESKLLERMN